MLKAFFNGAILLNSWAVSLFFYRFWRRTHDPLFGFFAAAFSLLGAERLGMFFFSEVQPLVYCIRLAAFLLIIYAIIYKNRPGGTVRPVWTKPGKKQNPNNPLTGIAEAQRL